MIIETSIQQVAATMTVRPSADPDRQLEIGFFAYTQPGISIYTKRRLVISLASAKFDNDEINEEIEIDATQTAIKYLRVPEFDLYRHDGLDLQINWM